MGRVHSDSRRGRQAAIVSADFSRTCGQSRFAEFDGVAGHVDGFSLPSTIGFVRQTERPQRKYVHGRSLYRAVELIIWSN